MTIEAQDIRQALALMLGESSADDSDNPIESWVEMLRDAGVDDPGTFMLTAQGFEQKGHGAAMGLVLGLCAGIKVGRMDAAKMMEGD